MHIVCGIVSHSCVYPKTENKKNKTFLNQLKNLNVYAKFGRYDFKKFKLNQKFFNEDFYHICQNKYLNRKNRHFARI